MDEEILMTLTDIAKELDVTRWAVQQWKKDKEFPPIRGSVIRSGREYPGYRLSEVRKWCTPRGLPNRTRQEEVRRSLDRRDDE